MESDKDDSMMMTLDPVERPENFWSVTKEDVLCAGSMILSTLIVWISVLASGPFDSVISYWDGPNYLYAGATLYKIPDHNPWTQFFQYPPSYFACHLPGFPLIIRIFSVITFSYKIGFHLAILFCGILLTYVFRRLLIITKAVVDPTWTTILLCFVPIRLIIYHSVGASETLFLSYSSLAFIFYKTDQYFYMLLAVWGGCITRIEGMAIGGTIGLCYLLRFKIFKAAGMFLTFLAPASMVLLHQYRFNDALAYLHFNQGQQGLVRWPPFHELLGILYNRDDFQSYSFLGYYALMAFGTALVYTRSIPLGIYSTCFTIYVSFLFHLDIYRYGLPAFVFAILVGFDGFWSSKSGKIICLVVSPLYIILICMYTSGQIHSNKAWPDFMNYMFKCISK